MKHTFPVSLLIGIARFVFILLLVALFTTVCICWDEFVFHRARCGPYETALHRALVFGNGLANLPE